MDKKSTKAIVLKRIDYGDYDRIITLLTPDFGRVTLMAKGVRKINSKLAGGIELFSVLDAGFMDGRGNLGRLTSARLVEYYDRIVRDINRVQLGYEILKVFGSNIEDGAESDYFYLLCQLLRLLNESSVSLTKIELYYKAKLLMMAGHTPNLQTDASNKKLVEDSSYSFNLPAMSLVQSIGGQLQASHIKLLRLLFDHSKSQKVFNISSNNQEDNELKPLVDAMFRNHLSV